MNYPEASLEYERIGHISASDRSQPQVSSCPHCQEKEKEIAELRGRLAKYKERKFDE